ncbi:MAG: glycoside hydrolase family 76 protein [Chloroflexota bacterium]
MVLAAALPPRLHTDSASPRSQAYRELATRIQAATWQKLAFLDGAPSCSSASRVTYRRDLVNTSISDHWYVALQVRADAALARLNRPDLQCNVLKAGAWMEPLWDSALEGFAPRADLDGTNPTVVDIYADDNAVIARAFLAIAQSAPTAAGRQRAIDNATRATAYLAPGHLWDDTYGGGVWWNNQRDREREGKPGQATALFALAAAELFVETGEPRFRDWAESALAWLQGRLWSPHHQLYAYSVGGDPANPRVAQRYFGYDQAIVIQTVLALNRREFRQDRLDLARALASRIELRLLHADTAAYTLEADGREVYTPYAAWMIESLIDLYEADGDAAWLAIATQRFRAIERLMDLGDGSYAMLAFPCGSRPGMNCLPGERYGRDTIVYGMTQAMMQQVATRLAAAYGTR